MVLVAWILREIAYFGHFEPLGHIFTKKSVSHQFRGEIDKNTQKKNTKQPRIFERIALKCP